MPASSPIAVYYEHPRWFDRLFAELERRGAPYHKIDAVRHRFAPETLGAEAEAALVLNRMSPSAYHRGHGSCIRYTVDYLSHLELAGKRVVNGSQAYGYEISKARQLSLLQSLGLPYPKARVIHRPEGAPAAAAGLRFPVVVKPNVGGSGVGVTRFDTPDALGEAARAGRLELGLDGVGLVQEFIPARGGHITRVEGLAGRFLYAINVYLTGETFDLCPADICQTTEGESLDNACPVEAPKAGLQVEGYRPPEAVIAAVERTLDAAGIEIGGIEYVVDDRDGQLYYYDVNALSNFVADAPRVIGFDPFVPFVDYLLAEAAKV
jgi:hypothetical protein